MFYAGLFRIQKGLGTNFNRCNVLVGANTDFFSHTKHVSFLSMVTRINIIDTLRRRRKIFGTERTTISSKIDLVWPDRRWRAEAKVGDCAN
jgi:hypothetical protein